MKKAVAKKDAKKGTTVKVVILAIAIILVLSFFVQVGIRTFYKEPDYANYCKTYNDKMSIPVIEAKNANCSYNKYMYDQAAKNCTEHTPKYNLTGFPAPIYSSNGCVESYYCEMCQARFEKAMENHVNVVFWISLILGVILLTLGLVIRQTAVSPGLMGGAVITIFIGIVSDWRFLSDYARFAILGLVLIILIWLAYKKLNK